MSSDYSGLATGFVIALVGVFLVLRTINRDGPNGTGRTLVDRFLGQQHQTS